MGEATRKPLDVEFGNAGAVDTHGTGWFVGFSEWSKSTGSHLRHMPTELASSGLCVKWFMHDAGDPDGSLKPVSEGRTMSILVGSPSEFRIDFSLSASFDPGETMSCVLKKPGDFAIWGHGIFHRAFGILPACMLTLRWLPKE
jgi:hypothetical protein